MHFTTQVLTVLATSLLAATAAAAPSCRVGTSWPDPLDCHKFFECAAGGVPVQKTCGPGTAYNPKLNVCDYEKNVPTCRHPGKPGWSKDDKGKGNDQWPKSGKDKREDLHSGWDHGHRHPHPYPWGWNEHFEHKGGRPHREMFEDDEDNEDNQDNEDNEDSQ